MALNGYRRLSTRRCILGHAQQLCGLSFVGNERLQNIGETELYTWKARKSRCSSAALTDSSRSSVELFRVSMDQGGFKDAIENH